MVRELLVRILPTTVDSRLLIRYNACILIIELTTYKFSCYYRLTGTA